MFNRKFLNMLVSLMVLTSLIFGGNFKAAAMPMGPVDETKVPHYFGPNPNWANSPLRVPDIAVSLTSLDAGTGATATATVDPQTGAVTGMLVLTPGTGYTVAPNVSFSGAGTNAAATALIDNSGILTAVTMTEGGNGYTAPLVGFTGGGATTAATATAYGSVDAVTVTAPGSAYTFATVEFSLPDGTNGVQATGHATTNASGAVVSVVVDNPGSGYSKPPKVTIHDCTTESPCNTGSGATASATLSIQSIILNTFGSGYSSAPTVDITDPTGTGATATAAFSAAGSVVGFTITNPGSGYMTAGIKKFVDALPGLCVPPACPASGKYIPLAMAEKKKYTGIEADEYVIGLVQYRTSFSSQLPDTLVRGYVQIETPANAGISKHFPLTNELQNGTLVPVKINGVQAYGVTPPQYLGPIIAATKDKPVRIVFRNLLPTGANGDLFLPTDSTLMGSGMVPMNMAAPVDQGSVEDMVRNPMCSEYPKGAGCFKDDRATLHLHGGTSPWISDGTAHQWITPAGESTSWPQGVSVSNVPDMGAVGCDAANDGCQTFYYTNQQSARLLFYHDHAWGITRLNVYAGEAAGYLISDATEQGLISSGVIPGAADTIPLIIQDKTFVPDDKQMFNQYDANGKVISYGQDPTWDAARWGKPGDLWYHHVYMPAQNPGDPSGMSAYGRWMYGPWFWPPATPPYGPIANPYYNMDPNANPPFSKALTTPCNLDDPATWQYQTDPFCEPQYIPGTPNVSVGMEQFNDTPIVNGVAYPTITLEPKTYRLRMLSAANDRFFNFQWYVADPTTASTDLNSLGQPIGGTEVAFKAAELAAAQTDPNVFPTPDTNLSKPGPDWIQIGSEGGFLPAPAVIDGQQVTTWITDPTRFDVGNVDQHSLTLAPAERADVIVDFSKFAGQTLILYNDAPAAFPARVPSYDYYTGAPDLSPAGVPSIPPGYGPNTRTIMQVKIAGSAAPAFNLGALQTAFKSTSLGGQGVFENGQHPIIVGQAAYNSAYGKNFAAGSNCNAANSTTQNCDGFVRVNDTATFGFNTLAAPTVKMTMPLQPKAIHDEMNSTTFDEYGRMQANLGVEAQPPTPGAQNVTLYPFVNPATELIDGTNLPKASVTYDSVTGLPVSDIKVTPISDAADGTQIWRITHNGVDTHPIHFHLYDVQVVNRVTWDNIIIPTEPSELGWKDTVRVSPLEDTIVALRPIVPQVPFEVPNAIRPLNPMMPLGDTTMFNNIDPQGNPTNPIINQLVNFGWEYVYHCHILSHEEMDMMRPVSLVLPPLKPTVLPYQITGSGNNRRLVLNWTDNSITETEFVVQSLTWPNTWVDVGRILSPLTAANTRGARSFTVPGTFNASLPYSYRIVAKNTVGYGLEFPTMTAQSVSDLINLGTAPTAPNTLVATLQAGPQVRLTWTDTASNEGGFVIQRSTDGVNFAQIATAPARSGTGSVTFIDTTVRAAATAQTYTYRVAASNVIGISAFTNTASVTVGTVVKPTAPTTLAASLQAGPLVSLTWTDTANNETGFIVQRSVNNGAFAQIGTASALNGTGTVTFNDTAVQPTSTGATYSYRVAATNAGGNSAFSNTASVTEPALPAAPSNFGVVNGPNKNKQRSVILTWADNSSNETGFTIERATNALFTQGLTTVTLAANTTALTQTGLTPNTQYWFRIRANNGTIVFTTWVTVTPLPITTNP